MDGYQGFSRNAPGFCFSPLDCLRVRLARVSFASLTKRPVFSITSRVAVRAAWDDSDEPTIPMAKVKYLDSAFIVEIARLRHSLDASYDASCSGYNINV